MADPAGYRNDAHWTRSGLTWRENRTAPNYWKDPKWHIANHPVIGVTWYESAAFCHWLTTKLQAVSHPFSQFPDTPAGSQFLVTLPSETEWEYAARRDTGREYPWKRDINDKWTEGDEARCNVRETNLGRTMAVGLFPNGATSDGLVDLTGNVWEWLGTTWDGDWRKVKDEVDGDAGRGLRGGSWAFNREIDLGSRNRNDPRNDLDIVGFRVVVRAHFSF